LLNAILDIFQFDPAKSTRYLDRSIPMLKGLLHKSANKLSTETDIACDPILHAIHSIVPLVGVKIHPFAGTFLPLVRPFLHPGNLNVIALKTLSAIMDSLKTSFDPFATDTFSQAPSSFKTITLNSTLSCTCSRFSDTS
jgi:hypothetical protein